MRRHVNTNIFTRDDAGKPEPEIHHPARRTRIARRDIHRHRPDRRHDQLGEKEHQRQTDRRNRQIVDQDHRNHEEKAADEARHDDAAPRRHQIARALQDRVAHHAAERIAHDPRKQHARREDGRPAEIQPVILHEEGRNPVLELPAKSYSMNSR